MTTRGVGLSEEEREALAPILADEIRMFAHAHGAWVALDLARHLDTHVVAPRIEAIAARTADLAAQVAAVKALIPCASIDCPCGGDRAMVTTAEIRAALAVEPDIAGNDR